MEVSFFCGYKIQDRGFLFSLLEQWCQKSLKGYCKGLISGYINSGVCSSKVAVGPGGWSIGDKD